MLTAFSSANDSLLPIYESMATQSESEPQSYITTDGQSASLSWSKAPIWSLRPDLYYCQTVAGLLMWFALSDERTGLSFTIAAGPRQRSNIRVRLPWDSWSCFTFSDSRLPFSSPPTTGRVTVEVFDPASTRECDSINYVSSFHTSVRTEYRTLPSTVHVIACLSVAV
jgi:hypothetical protein